MPKIILTVFFILTGILNSISQEKHTITVYFEGMKSDKGNLYVAIYNHKKDFLKEPIKGKIIKISDKKASLVFENMIAGTYAISAFHDVNDNKKMDTNFIGIPKEPIGISNDAKGFMGPPKYKDAKFDVIQSIKMTIRIK
ncbi:DUF2141 domain-containing protein [Tenacibaculum finnmarkense]|uniref:DUF2141 domain-containing protein n=1 Tax=Tenacibaculum finnmarkense genomovar ulcerans TaxID=2781388 RepID=A0A2I2M768_9FLAO|nr:DUF2141 domain-containing protein [Tenacibaculum finnmarkense]MBE7646389.1 DUF2141 domain-containing protein [Tenacibaculum finnmarkense genomovar ulcerans]MBE7648526.1 DUF2141 domain-containing protein [Tenacibaculum finnmarkense genomovar ulcerans]MBE7688594.1 DUF2141 domain-containing protein [Tenacibaculum finnmarkense genomovar ulcerans]MBE7698308.1 DUF2141 domain-containing protein [Tenacibaculum finnmarkense genomovar ulcerans]MCD8401192.1 DUF2141 domain-containing protein [Tenacibac